MLAYAFWHWPADPGGYEERLAAFQRALAADPPPGFQGSACFRVDPPEPWHGGAPGYLDWYLVADWTALGALNDAAVRGARRASHDAAAGRAGGGTAGVYRHLRGPLDLGAVRHVAWLGAPPDDAPGALWQRQMTLGPAPEYALLTAEPPGRAAAGLRAVG